VPFGDRQSVILVGPHHLSQLWADPFGFDLDRFLPRREGALSRGAAIPFWGCSRMCLGNRMGEYELRARDRAARSMAFRALLDRSTAPGETRALTKAEE
jgi:cytochrome P450